MPGALLGRVGQQTKLVTADNAISFLSHPDARVLATPWLIAYLEMTARDAVKPCLLDVEDTVGTQVNVSHLAAAPLGTEVQFRAEVTAVDGRRITFRVSAWDRHGPIGEGTHERAVINVERFAEKLRGKRTTSGD